MADESPSPNYFPDVAKCLSGEEVVRSWDDLFEALFSRNHTSARTASSLLSEDPPTRILQPKFPHFPPPNASSKTAFDSAFSALPAPSDRLYNPDDLKEDALWLSKQLNLNEQEALRLALLEWEYRSESRLRLGYSEAEVASLKEALGSDYVDRHLQAKGALPARDDATFTSRNSRRARSVRLYLHQQVLVLRLGKDLTDVYLRSKGEGPEIPGPCWDLAAHLRAAGRYHLNEDVADGIKRIQVLLQSLESGPSWDVEEPELGLLKDARDTATLQMIGYILETLLLAVASSEEKPSSESVRFWFQFMSSVAFFASFTSEVDAQAMAIQKIQSTAALVSLTILNVRLATEALRDAVSGDQSVEAGSYPEYFLDLESVAQIHEMLSEAASAGNVHAGPAILAWALIIHGIKHSAFSSKEKRESQQVQRSLDGVSTFDAATGRRTSSSTGSQTSIFEDLSDAIITHGANDDPSTLLLDAALDQCNIASYIAFLCDSSHDLRTQLSIFTVQALQQVVGAGQLFLGYTPELVASQLALLTTNRTSKSKKRLVDPAKEFLEDAELREGFYDTAAARFPYECLPFLQFCRTLARVPVFSTEGIQFVEYRLRNMTSFTQAAVNGVKFSTTREDEHGSFVALDKSVNLLDMSQNQLLTYTGQERDATSIIAAQTVGELISNPDAGSPVVIRWQHEFSGLAYLGQLLELHYMGLLATSLSPSEDLEGVVSEVLGLLTTLLSTILNDHTFQLSAIERLEHCFSILAEVGSKLISEADVVTYVFDILEQELQSFRRRTVSGFDCRILTSCLDFMVVLTKTRPQLIWSNLGRTSLLVPQSASSPILAIVSGAEAPLRSFNFLESCTKLYESLIDLALRSKPYNNATNTGLPAKSTISAAGRIQSPMLTTATEIMYSMFQGISDWPFEDPQQQLRISTNITDSFSKVIRYAYGVGLSLESPSIITAPFAAAATYLTSAFRASALDDVRSDPIARSLFAISSADYSFLLGDQSVLSENVDFERQACSVLSLATLLVRYSHARNLPLSSLEKHIFDMVPALVRTLHLGSPLHSPCLKLLRSTMVYVEHHIPSSLLGQLGSASSIDLLNLLRHIDANSGASEERAEVWNLLSQLVKDSQHWLAMVILTGSAPDSSNRTRPENKLAKCVHGKNFLEIAMDDLKEIDGLPRTLTIAMLDFVLQAQQNWSWVTKDLSSSNDFFTRIVQFVTSLRPNDSEGKGLANQNMIAAYVTDITTTHLHHAKVSRESNILKTYIPLIHWLASNAAKVDSYNTSLHANLRRNFSGKYTGLSPSDIKSTEFREHHFGPKFYYDLEFGDKLFEGDSSWHGIAGKSSNQSFSAEFGRANANLSVVESELALLSSLQRLCIDHCKFFVQDREVQRAMARIIRHSLQANAQAYPGEALFDSLFQTRADLSMALLCELVACRAKGSEFVELLNYAWTAARFRSGSYEQAIVNNDLVYWRTILSNLLMTVHFHVNKKQKATTIPGSTMAVFTLDPQNPTILEITSSVVAEGFRSIVVALQDQKEKGVKTDAEDETDLVGLRHVSLLLTLMQAVLRLPSLPQFAAELSERLSSSGIISSCLVLYSWSHLLNGSGMDKQPRYADYCIQLLASISSLPSVAEELAVEGVLNRMLSAKTTEALQRVPGGASHTDNRPDCAFLYRIWVSGMLPLCLNLLHAVGGAIAPEISAFLNQFPDQLVRASTSLMPTPSTKAGTSVLSLSVASEAATLALLSYGLASYRDAGASAAVDPTTIMPLIGYDEHRKAIVEDLRDLVAMKQDARRKITVATDEKDLSWQSPEDGDKLDAKIVKELKMAIVALSRDEDDDEK
ncbi:hypothetical protein H2200_013508 [Cladophialophora chaetospira]|uniref:Nucleoporin NUP188 n=1 Tax=Cladophialophora chaetospira TaxID=386627 RepID=A0AA38TYW8_9EURO|nr:hypothetical protein H2200_013508 [Cladophialophora chaetospira]